MDLESQDSQDSEESLQETPIVEKSPNVIVNYKDVEISKNVSNISIPGPSDTTTK